MLLTKNGILAIEAIAINPHEMTVGSVQERIESAFSRHNGVIAFYAFLADTHIGHGRVEEAIAMRIQNELNLEGFNPTQTAAGARLFKLSLNPVIAIAKKSLLQTLSSLGVNAVRNHEGMSTLWGCTILASPTEKVKSKYNKRDLECCTLGDFKLLM